MRLESQMSSTPHIFKEISQFEIALKGGSNHIQDLSDFFSPGDITLVRVPARLDVLGGIADYSGSNVCEATLECGIALGIQFRNDSQIHIRSLNLTQYDLEIDFQGSLKNFYANGQLLSYKEAQKHFQGKKQTSWAAYIMGAIFVLLKENQFHELKQGLNIALISEVPIQVGIGSSATAEIATLHAMNCLLGLGLDGLTLAKLGQLTENQVVGAPCGIMDQLAVTWGQADYLSHILCQPGSIQGTIAIPDNYTFFGLNSKVHHSVAGSKYTNVRIGTFMGRKIISLDMQKKGLLAQNELLDYLCNVNPETYENHYRNLLPESITGENFLNQYGDLNDPATTIDPQTTYNVRSRTAHPIYENDRVLKFIALLNKANEDNSEATMKQIGRLMLMSHDSYRRNCELSCEEVDQLVEIIREEGKKYAFYGAKITGGGSGGTVAVVGKKKHIKAGLKAVIERYNEVTGKTPDVFLGSSPGALLYGNRKYRLFA